MADLTEAVNAAAVAIYDDRRLWETFTEDQKRNGSPRGARQLVAEIAMEAAAPIIERQVRAEVAEGIAQAIEASIITDDEARYANCTCLDGTECHPHACHRAMNNVPADEDTWPVHIKIGVWRELDPLIRNHAAEIARGYTRPAETGQEAGR